MITASLLALALSVSAQAPIDIVTQDIDVRITPNGVHLVIDVQLTLAGADSVPIYALGAPLESALVDDAAVELTDDTDYPGLVSWIPMPASDGAHHVLLTLDGALQCASQVQPGYDACVYASDEFVLLPAEPAAAWYLTNLYAVDAFTGSITVHAPAALPVFAGEGAAVSHVDEDDGTVATRFDVALPTENLSVVARAVDTVTAQAGAQRVVALVPDEAGRAAMQRVADMGAAALPYYEEHFGALDLDEVRYVMSSGNHPFGAIGLLGQVVMRDFISWPQFDYLVEQGAAHELGHSWWGGLTSASDPASGGFLQEAFAEYSAWRAMGARFGDDARVSGVRMNAVWYLTQIDSDADLGIIDPAVQDDYATYILVTYHKGSTVLAALESEIGEDAMDTALSALVARGPGELSVPHLIEDVNDAADFDADAFFAQWLEQPGFPSFTVSAKGDDVTLADDSGFAVDLPVVLVATDGTRTETKVHVDGRGTLDTKGAALVELDPRWTHVRALVPAVAGDVSFDARVDALDLLEIALRAGGAIPADRRVDGKYDPLYDVDGDGVIDAADVSAANAAVD
jgi:hypothetical protein